MGRILSVGLVAGLLAPFPGNPVRHAPEILPASIDIIRAEPAAAGPREAQVERRAMSGGTGLILLMTIALKGLHGS
jgi:hypothetical protein